MNEAKASNPAGPPIEAPESGKTSKQPRSEVAKLALGALGVVYGDIGTSPLYALKECVTMPHGVSPDVANIFGLLSLIFWSITLIVSAKYILYVMRADNNGEGGVLALMALAAREQQLHSAQDVQSYFQRQGIAMWRARAEQVYTASLKFPKEKLETAIALVFRADRDMKGSRPDDRIVMEDFVLRLT